MLQFFFLIHSQVVKLQNQDIFQKSTQNPGTIALYARAVKCAVRYLSKVLGWFTTWQRHGGLHTLFPGIALNCDFTGSE